jgi:hypothetical protein
MKADTSFDLAVKSTARLRNSFAKLSSRTWYAEDISRCLHNKLHSYDDAKSYAEKTSEKIFGVYLRHEGDQKRRVKIGKGVVYTRNGKTNLTRSHESASEQPLNNDVFIPCKDEMASLALEAAIHYYFGKLEGVHRAAKSNGKIVEYRWLKPAINNEGQEGGTELFDFEDCWDKRAEKFVQVIQELTSTKTINKSLFNPKIPQITGSDLIVEWLLRGGEMQDFFLLKKPRSGKNATMLLGLAKFIKVLKDRNIFDKKIIVDFLSLWPSAFSGCIKDIKKFLFVEGVNIEFVNTDSEEWQTIFERLLDDPEVDCIVRFASMQSLNNKIADEYNNDEDLEGIEINFDETKYQTFLKYPADIAVFDESDHGMRTSRSNLISNSFNYKKCLWMSGTDLYAIKHLIRHGNHFLYDVFDEIQDVKSGRIPRMPMMRKGRLSVDQLPFALDPAEMDIKGLSRRIVVLFKTNISQVKGWCYDKVNDRIVNTLCDNREYKFDNLGEAQRLWEKIWFDWEQAGMRSPESHSHIFTSMPSVASCFAMYNHIRNGDIECKHEPIIANLFKNASTIEQDINDFMGFAKRTAFFTVGKMLRGAKAPWSCVVRFDDYSDFKIGLQLELRGQNTEEDYFDVYDANFYRAASMKYEMVRSRTNGKKVDTAGRELNNLIPMMRKGEFTVDIDSWEDVIEGYQSCFITEGYKRFNLIDERSLKQVQELLTGVAEVDDNNSNQPRDPNAGKVSKPDPKNKPKLKQSGIVDPLIELKKKALTISSMLPILIVLSNGNYTEIDDLINYTDDKLFVDWLDHCGIDATDDLIEVRNQIVSIFNAEEINHQINFTSRKIKTQGIDSIDWSEFNRKKYGDVNTPKSAVESLLDSLDESFWASGPTVLDPSCGTGEWLVYISNKLKEHGFDPNTLIEFADSSEINLRITALRLGFNNGFCYNVTNKGKDLVDTFMKKYSKEFDLYTTNPPFQKAEKTGRDNDNLWPKFLELGHRLTKKDGYQVMVTPGSWASLGANEQSPGSSDRKKYFDTKQVDVVDFTIGEHFDVGSTFTGYVIKQTVASINHTTKLVFKDNTINSKFGDYPCFSLWYSNSEFIDILKKFRTSKHYDIIAKDPYPVARGSMPKKIEDGAYSKDQSANNPHRAYHTNAQTHLYTKHINSFHNQWKAVFSYSGSWKVEVTNDCSLTDASMCVLCDNEQEARSVQSVLQSEPIKFLIDKVFRWGGYYNALFIKWIPSLPKNKIYTVDEVYNLLFTIEQTELIKNYISLDSKKKAKKS